MDSDAGIKKVIEKVELFIIIYYTECKEIFSGAGNGLIEASFEWMHTFARNKSYIYVLIFCSCGDHHRDLREPFFAWMYS